MALVRFPPGSLLALTCATSIAWAAETPSQKFVFEKAEMGVPFRITLYAEGEATAKAASDAAFARIEALNRIFSDYEDDSELTLLSRTSGQGRAVKVSDELWLVLARSQQLAERTGGGYDVTCGPLVNVWRRARRKHELPSPDLVTEMRSRVGWRKMRLEEKSRTVELLTPEMRLDLGSIAKGYACDEAVRVLRAQGCPRSLVAGSGDMVAGDAPPDRKGWHIEVEALDEEPPGRISQAVIVEITNAAIATSGDRFQRLEIGGKRFSHILDLRAGQPLQDHSLVSVIAPDGITADSLATAASVLGPAEGMRLVGATPGAAVLFQRQTGGKVEISESPGWSNRVLKR
jgi:thiamine biosynthesis lipoprotein